MLGFGAPGTLDQHILQRVEFHIHFPSPFERVRVGPHGNEYRRRMKLESRTEKQRKLSARSPDGSTTFGLDLLSQQVAIFPASRNQPAEFPGHVFLISSFAQREQQFRKGCRDQVVGPATHTLEAPMDQQMLAEPTFPANDIKPA
jgi:hypothetical protein